MGKVGGDELTRISDTLQPWPGLPKGVVLVESPWPEAFPEQWGATKAGALSSEVTAKHGVGKQSLSLGGCPGQHRVDQSH